MEQNTIGGMTLYGLGSKARLYYVCADGQADVVADGKIESSIVDEVQQDDSFKEEELITSLYDPRIAEIMKNPNKPQVLGKGWKTSGKPEDKEKTYTLQGKDDLANYVDLTNNKISISLTSPYIFQTVDMQYDKKTFQLLPETVSETFTEN